MRRRVPGGRRRMARKFCRKCMRGYNTTYESLQASKAANDKSAEEQFLSGICSDNCWYACTEEEIVFYKYYKPYSYGATEKVVLVDPETGSTRVIDTKR